VAAAAALVAAALTSPALAGNGKPPSGTATGRGRVFAPNPVVALNNPNLTDQNDADYAALQAAYKNVALTHLDGSGYLRGQYANVLSETGNPAYSPTNVFEYGRSDDRFEQVMGYYWVTETQKYIQSLGFGTGKRFRPVNEESQDLRLNQWGQDNSFSWDKHDMIKLGKGGVDDAEDADVIVHEYGHAVHDAQVPGFGYTLESGSIGEAFGDYLAVTVTNVLAPGPETPCVADWDAVSYRSTPWKCLRRVDGNKHYPQDVIGEVHADGEIWSRALWDIRVAFGNVKADTLILESQFSFAPDTTFNAAADATVATAKRLGYSRGDVSVVRKAFTDRGFTVTQ
jgi:hypothetical protein